MKFIDLFAGIGGFHNRDEFLSYLYENTKFESASQDMITEKFIKKMEKYILI